MLGVTAGCLMGVLEPLLGKLSDILGSEFIQLKDSHREIFFLRDELSTMKVALEMMSEQEEADPLASQWMSQLKELAYDVEDVVDTYLLQPSNVNTNSGLIAKILNKFSNLKANYQFADDIKQLKERTLEVSDRRKRYKMEHVASPKNISLDPRLPALFVEPKNLVGIEDQTTKRVYWIMDVDEHPEFRVLSIVGLGGLGKTTLANLLFKNVTCHFECTAFVSASRSPDVLMILKHILVQLCKGNLPTADQLEDLQEDHQLRALKFTEHANAIRQYLQDKRFLIVLDDIWDRKAWKEIQCAFPQNTKGSRIIATTRIQDVAVYCSSQNTDHVYYMTPLDAEKSRELFLKRVFHSNEECPADLKTTTDSILKKCQGLPLAIVSIGSLLANKTRSKEVWESVLNSLGSALEQDPELEIAQRILCLSYYDLPSHLKICFLDLSTFPEDYEIKIPRLIRRWMAQGFVVERQGKCLEETAETYMVELINRNMVQPMDIDYNGKAKVCKLHDMMLDLAVALSQKENFSTVIDARNKLTSWKKIRRLSLQENVGGNALWQGRDFSHVRSLTTFVAVEGIPPIINFRCLRLLDMHACGNLDTSYIRDIGSLTHLRYVCLRGENITRIPHEIGHLKLLQTLDVRATGIVDLPESIGQLEQLLCLLVSGTVRLPSSIRNMSSLQELAFFSALKNSSHTIEQLGNLKNLKNLFLWWFSDDSLDNERRYKEACLSSLRRLGNIQSLYIESMEYCSLDFLNAWCPPPRCLREFVINCLSPFFTYLPQWIKLSELAILQIWVQKLRVEDMKILEGLPSLVHLNIDTAEGMEETYNVSGFQNLEMFSFCTMLNFRAMGLRFENGAAQCVQNLALSVDAKVIISTQGSGISHLSCLKDLLVYMICQGANAREVEVAEATIRSEVAFLPNHPTTQILKH